VTLTISRGEFWFFLGPNGEGKSTLLKGILGIVPPLSGQMEFGASFEKSRSIGFVPQRCELNPTLPTTVREFVGLGRVGILDKASTENIDLLWSLEHVGLEEFRDKNYWTLSGGQRQRALVARGLIRRPQVLIADEPTNGLDVASETALLDNLARLHQ